MIPRSIDRRTTIDNYLTLFRAYIIPKWGEIAAEDVKTVAVESWLHSLKRARSDKRLAPASKAKVKSAMYSLFDHAMRQELCSLNSNPIEKVRQGSKRLKKPDILTLDEIRSLMLEVPNPAIRLAVLVAGSRGFAGRKFEASSG